MSVINNGEIIEFYNDDYPYPSCLILGYSGEIALHVVASINEGIIHLISAYVPDLTRWEKDFRTRKDIRE